MKAFINFCSIHRWTYAIIGLIIFISCFMLLTLEIWISDKLTNATGVTFKQTLRSYFYNSDTKDLDLDKGLPYFMFSPLFLVLSTIILICSFVYWILNKGEKNGN